MVQEALGLSTPPQSSLPRLRDGISRFFDSRITLCQVSNQPGAVQAFALGIYWAPRLVASERGGSPKNGGMVKV